jgi:hypothetical protein
MSGDDLDLRARMDFDAATAAQARDQKRRDFVLAVVNGEDRADVLGGRNDFAEKYVGWFPPFSEANWRTAEEEYRGQLRDWRRLETNDGSTGDVDTVPSEKPHPHFGPYVAILRYKLRVIWNTAQTNPESAERRVGYLQTDIRRQLRGDWGCAPHYHDVRGATEWLADNVSKLKICKYPSCTAPFFIRKEKNQQYCSPECSAEGQRLGWESRSKNTTRVLSPEGRANIVEAQKERHAENRAAKIADNK